MIFTTAFIDIGRKDWGPFARDFSKYIQHFNNMMDDGFEHPLIVYTHTDVIKSMLMTRSYPSNIHFADISGVDTFLKEPYISKETEIMNSAEFKAKIPPFRKRAIEHNYPHYTLLTHSKICFLRHTRNMFPNQPFYAWIDFGYPVGSNICGWPPCPYPAVPRTINMELLERKVHIASTKVLDHHVSEAEFLSHNHFAFNAFSFIVHNDILELLYFLYKAKLEQWQAMNHADDEQNLMYQLYQDNKDLFKVFQTRKSPWGLFQENLNVGAAAPIVL
jgi:hypothetical protein